MTLCASCQTPHPPGFRFCGNCGARVADPESAVPDAERRTLTVLFCDLVGSGAIAEATDPEDLRAIMAVYHELCADAIGRFGGHIAQYLGDGVLAYFGYPRAHEDDPNRAAQAALALIDAVPEANRQVARALASRTLKVRIALHTGPVVVGDVGIGESRRPLALGNTLTVAARLQALAEPDTCVVSDATRRRLDPRFALRALGDHSLPGLEDPIAVFHVAARKQRPGVGRSRAPFVGRQAEKATLFDHFRRAVASNGQVVALDGEAGTGKSRLIHMLRRECSNDAFWFEARANALAQHSALYPVTQVLRAQLGEDPKRASTMLRSELRELGQGDPASYDLFARLLSFSDEAGSVMPPIEARQRTLELIEAWLIAQSAERPVVAVVEDLHWLDPTTLELVGRIAKRVAGRRILLLLSARSGFAWSDQSFEIDCRIDIAPLGEEEMAVLARGIAGESLTPGTLRRIVDNADGVPLFVEELAKNVALDRGGATLTIPESIEALLATRLDALPIETRRAALWASVLGRDFDAGFLEAIAPEAKPAEAALEHLVEAGVLVRRAGEVKRYAFRHALFARAAYESLLRKTRRMLHERVARQSRDRDAPNDWRAWHFSCADLPDEATEEYRRAAADAYARAELSEARVYLRRALAHNQRRSNPEHRDRCELEIQLELGAVATTEFGSPHEDVEASYAHAAALALRCGDTTNRCRALHGLAVCFEARGEIGRAKIFADELLELAGAGDDPEMTAMASQETGILHYWQGEFRDALSHCETTLDALATLPQKPLENGVHLAAPLRRLDPGVAAACVGAQCAWHLGDSERVTALLAKAESTSEERGRHYDHAYARCFSAALSWMAQAPKRCLVEAERARRAADPPGYPLLVGVSEVLAGWALARTGEPLAGLERLEYGRGRLMAGDLAAGAPLILGCAAEVYWLCERRDEALRTLASAFEISEKTGQHLWDAELERLWAHLCGEREGPDSRRRHLRHALEIAKKAQSTALELRIAIDLAREASSAERAIGRQCLGASSALKASSFDAQLARDILRG